MQRNNFREQGKYSLKGADLAREEMLVLFLVLDLL